MALTKPNPALLAQLGERLELAEQDSLRLRDEEVKRTARAERDSEVRHLTRRAHQITISRCIYTGSHAYLGSDALSRDYHSSWFPIEDLPTTRNQVEVDAQLERVDDIVRQGSIETGEAFRNVSINLRYRDITTSIATDPVVFCRLEENSITLSPGQPDRLVVEPHTEPWGEIITILDKLEFPDPLRPPVAYPHEFSRLV